MLDINPMTCNMDKRHLSCALGLEWFCNDPYGFCVVYKCDQVLLSCSIAN